MSQQQRQTNRYGVQIIESKRSFASALQLAHVKHDVAYRWANGASPAYLADEYRVRRQAIDETTREAYRNLQRRVWELEGQLTAACMRRAA